MISGHICMHAQSLSHAQLFVTPWNVAHQVPLSMEFSKQEYQSGLPFPSPRDLPDPRIEPASSALQADVLPSEPPGKLTYMWNLFFKKVKLIGTFPPRGPSSRQNGDRDSQQPSQHSVRMKVPLTHYLASRVASEVESRAPLTRCF